MVAVITGDIIGSRTLDEGWMEQLKVALSSFSKQVKWEIFRGDSFQAVVEKSDALLFAIYIKATMKMLKNGDVRLAIGLGKIKEEIKKVAETQGEAFVNSGQVFDGLKTNMAIKSNYPRFDSEINLMLKLALVPMDAWGQTAAELVKLAIANRNVKQSELAKLSGRSQSSVSEALKRAHFAEIMELETYFREKVNKLK